MSITHIVTVLMFHAMRYSPDYPDYPTSDRLVLSEGHAVPAVYAAAAKLGPSPAHKDGELYQTADAFVVAKPGADAAPRVVFQTKFEVAGKKMTPEIVRQLLAEGRTELIDGFMSKAGRAFSAYLVLSKDKKKAEFEFPPR